MFHIAKGEVNLDFLECSDDLKDFLDKCLKINPLERYNCYKLLRHRFLCLELKINTQLLPTINEINEGISISTPHCTGNSINKLESFK